jgi:cytidylate kinase
MWKPRTIAIDGPVAVGKNAVGSLLAERLRYRFLDTGAMYRALTWKAICLGMDLEDEPALGELAVATEIDLVAPGGNSSHGSVLVDGEDVSSEIRREEVERGVSPVSMVAQVREELVAKQRRMARGDGVVMVGRDIGTVVLPDADLKIYLVASPEVRADRRHRELVEQGKQVAYEQVLSDLERRDRLDSQRPVSPLKPAADARMVDTDGLDIEQVLARIFVIIDEGQ